MTNAPKKKVLAISGSTRVQSSNLHLIHAIADLAKEELDIEVYSELDALPHFNPDIDTENVPPPVERMRAKITGADGVLICTPEYVFSLPGSLKNLIEWTVSTTVLLDKPVALITASGLGEKAHESLQLIMQTVGARWDKGSQILIQGSRSKVNRESVITDELTLEIVKELIACFI